MKVAPNSFSILSSEKKLHFAPLNLIMYLRYASGKKMELIKWLTLCDLGVQRELVLTCT